MWMLHELISSEKEKILIQYIDNKEFDVIPRTFLKTEAWYNCNRGYKVILNKSKAKNLVKNADMMDFDDMESIDINKIIKNYVNKKKK